MVVNVIICSHLAFWMFIINSARNFVTVLSSVSIPNTPIIAKHLERSLKTYQLKNIHLTSFQNTMLTDVPKVDIDPEGVFKYILINCHGSDKDGTETSTTIVRGYKRCNYHSDIYDEVQEKLKPLDCEPLGGGRISHEPDNKKIHIYGYSQGYGKADHEVTAKLVKDAYPGYTVTISDEGY